VTAATAGGDTMLKTRWDRLITRFPSPHLVVASLPDETFFSANEAKQLLERLLRKLPTQGEYAVTISRRRGQLEILSGFGDSSDANLAARTAGASTVSLSEDLRVRHSFVLNEAAGRRLLAIAGQPRKRKQPRSTPLERWQS
jgi:hypothetical protein